MIEKEAVAPEVVPNLLFVYGILKVGQCADLRDYGQKHIGPASLPGANLYRIGGGVGLRLTDNQDDVAHGDVFEIIDNSLWHRFLDRIESNGYVYTRKVVKPIVFNKILVGEAAGLEANKVEAWTYEHTYYPASHYGHDLIAKIEGGTF